MTGADVLDPRGDTETLVEACLALGPRARVLDLGTGSGILGITLAAEWPEARVVCTDLSDAALQIAAENAQAVGVADRVQFTQSDWYQAVTGRFDLIVSITSFQKRLEHSGSVNFQSIPRMTTIPVAN